jgi:hypothetical protein
MMIAGTSCVTWPAVSWQASDLAFRRVGSLTPNSMILACRNVGWVGRAGDGHADDDASVGELHAAVSGP